MKKSTTTLSKCLEQVFVLAQKQECFADELPEVLKDNFNAFIVGKTVSFKEN